MDSSSTSFFEFIAIGLLLVYLFGKLLGFRRRVRGKSGKRAFSSHKASKGNAQRLAPTERQIALVDAMRKEGLLSDLARIPEGGSLAEQNCGEKPPRDPAQTVSEVQ